MKEFGITLLEYDCLLNYQNGRCLCCDTETSENSGKFHIDHEHVKGYEKLPPEEKNKHIRGLLCHNCNAHRVGMLDYQTSLKIPEYLGRDTGLDFRCLNQKDKRQLAEHHFCCDFCGTTRPGGRGCWHTDHEPVTDVVRGWLCHNCNISRIGSNTHETIPKVIRYLDPKRIEEYQKVVQRYHKERQNGDLV